MTDTANGADSLQLMTFKIGGQELGVDIMSVREIRVWTEPTLIPHMPAMMRGVINLRGHVLPIVDLSEQLGWGETRTSPTHVVIVLSVRGEMHGIIVDAVSDIVTVAASELRPVPASERSRSDDVVKGLITSGQQMITVLDLERLPVPSADLELAA